MNFVAYKGFVLLTLGILVVVFRFALVMAPESEPAGGFSLKWRFSQRRFRWPNCSARAQ